MPGKVTVSLTKRTRLNGRRIRLPLSVLYSKHHSPLCVVTYALLDVMGGPTGPVIATRPWLAKRLGCSLGGFAKALTALTREHQAPANLGTLPAHVVSTPQGNGLAAERITIPGIPWVDLPEWTLGDDVDGPLVSARAFRLYAVIVDKRAPRRPWCALPRRDLAALIRVDEDSIPALLAELDAAGMLVIGRRPGETTLLLPLLVQVDEAERATLPDRLIEASATPRELPVRPLNTDDAPHPGTGSSLHPSTGSSLHPSTSTSREGSDLGRTDLRDPRGAAPAPSGAGGPAESDDVVIVISDRQAREQVVESFAAAADRRAAARAAAAAAAAKFAQTRTTSTGGLAALIAAVDDLEPAPHAREAARLAG